jgi:hypothetical protein
MQKREVIPRWSGGVKNKKKQLGGTGEEFAVTPHSQDRLWTLDRQVFTIRSQHPVQTSTVQDSACPLEGTPPVRGHWPP